MKRTNLVTNLISLLLLGAVMAYLGVYIVRSMTGDVRTAPAVRVELADTAAVSGILVRDETLVTSGESYISVSAENGRLVAAGETVAVAYSGEESLLRAGEIRELELKRQYILSAMAGRATGTELRNRDDAIRSAITRLSAASSRHETGELPAASLTLASLVMETQTVSANETELGLIDSRLRELKQTASRDTLSITAASQGLFFSAADGFEHVRPEDLEGMGPEALRSLMNSSQTAPENVIGKLADPLEWYFAALVPAAAAEKLKVGDTAYMDFGRYQSESLRSSVWSVSSTGGDEAAVVFRFTASAADMLAVRKTSANLVFGTVSGIRVPRDAVYRERVKETVDGVEKTVEKTFVYTLTGIQAEKKYIDIIWEDEDYFLAEPASLEESASLREGNDIILTGKEIYDGMVLSQ